MGYTLKLDLTVYQHGALLTLLRTEIEAAERLGRSDTPFVSALAEVEQQITGYDQAVAQARELTAQEP